jgi:hypothetical protein
MDGPLLSLQVFNGSQFIDPGDSITLDPCDIVRIGVINQTSDKKNQYDGYVIITDGLAAGSWTGNSWYYDYYSGIPGWTYYGTSVVTGMDAWYAQMSVPSLEILPLNTVNAWVEYQHNQFGQDATITLYNEFYEPVDTLIIQGSDIQISAPNGGENILTGSSYEISWLSHSGIPLVDIEYSDDNGSGWTPIVASTPNDGQYLWDPVAEINSDECLIRISDASNSAVNDTSDDLFTIYECFLGPFEGDLNGDCFVDLRDLSLMVQYWLRCGNPFDSNCTGI